MELFDPEKNIMEDNLMGQVIKFIGNEAQLFGWKGRFRLSVSLAMVVILVFMLLLMLTGAQPLGAGRSACDDCPGADTGYAFFNDQPGSLIPGECHSAAARA